MKNSKAQISMEYMIIVGFVAVITIPLIVIYYTYSSDTNEQITANQVDQIAKKIVDAAESVYYLGEPSQTTVKVYMPNNVIEAAVANREILFRVKAKSGVSDIEQISSVDMSGTLPTTQGIHFIRVKAVAGGVEVSYT